MISAVAIAKKNTAVGPKANRITMIVGSSAPHTQVMIRAAVRWPNVVEFIRQADNSTSPIVSQHDQTWQVLSHLKADPDYQSER